MYPVPHRTPDTNPGSNSDTICLERDRGRTLHESDPRDIVSDSDMSSLIPRECRVHVGRSVETDPTRTSSHPDDEALIISQDILKQQMRSTNMCCVMSFQTNK